MSKSFGPASPAQEVLADLFEEVTGDLDKWWPPTWMAVQVMRHAVKAEDSRLYTLAANLAIDADLDMVIIAEAVVRNRSHWIVVDRDPQHVIIGDLGDNHYFAAETAIRQIYYQTIDIYRFDLIPWSDEKAWVERDRRTVSRMGGVTLREYIADRRYNLGGPYRHTRQLMDWFDSDDPRELFEAYVTIASHTGFSFIDNLPITLHGEVALNKRWSKFPFD